MMNIKTHNLESDKTALYYYYPGQSAPQDAYVQIDENGDISASWDSGIGNAIPADVWHGRNLRIPVSCYANAHVLSDYLRKEETINLFERINAGHEIKWDGSNRTGKLTNDAKEALSELECQLAEMFENRPNNCIAPEDAE